MNESAVLIVEDDANLREALYDTLASDSVKVLTAGSGAAALEILGKFDVGLVVSDLQMEPMDGVTLLRSIRELRPSLPAVLMTAFGTIENAVDAMRNGACDYIVKPFNAGQLHALVNKYMAPADTPDHPVAVDPAMREVLRIAKRVAATEATVTITGESGSGKEVVARFIHEQSPRGDQPFVAINCAAIPENMLEAVLFGYEKGAFTGATGAHRGKFEQANNGTLLLDEVTEMDLGLQAKLLRVIQEKEVERIGGKHVIPLNVRVLATTNRDFKACVAESTFREDLYYRLNVFPLEVPPLRQRRKDILPLAALFLRRHAKGGVKQLDDDARQRLLSHPWPGNVRELDNLVQRSLILARGQIITAADLTLEPVVPTSEADDPALQRGLADRESQLILDALAANNGHRKNASAALGISPRTLRYKLSRMRDRGDKIPGDRHE